MSDMPDLSALFSMLSNSQGASGNANTDSMKEIISNLMNSSSNSSLTNDSKILKNDMHFATINADCMGQNTTNTPSAKQENSSNCNASNSDANSFNNMSMPGMETMMKIMSVMKNANKPAPSSELLKSLKPFLNETRKEKVDQYIKIIGVTKAFEAFNEFDNKK